VVIVNYFKYQLKKGRMNCIIEKNLRSPAGAVGNRNSRAISDHNEKYVLDRVQI
jgi:hypothetical protein